MWTVASSPLPGGGLAWRTHWAIQLSVLFANGSLRRSFLRFLLILLFEKSQDPTLAVLKLATSFIKLVFTREMEATASNVEEMAMEEMNQYP